MKVHCFYHRADLDGHCSGAIVAKWCGINGHEFVPHGVNYGESVDWMAGAGPDAMAVITDFTPEGDGAGVMLSAMSDGYGRGLVWIDHHKTALERIGVGNLMVLGRRGSGTAACVLTWQYFFRDKPLPSAVRWLGAYDVFDREDEAVWEWSILPFQYGMKMRLTDPGGASAVTWDMLLNDRQGSRGFAVSVVADGRVALTFERENNRKTAKAAAYDCVFEGLLCCAINARGNSLVLDSYARPEHKMRILWGFTGGVWRVSLYENGHADVDCGEIAKRFGGGGHKGAAGFEMSNERWLCGPVLCPSGGRWNEAEGMRGGE